MYGSPPQDFRDEPRDKAEKSDEHRNGRRAGFGKDNKERNQKSKMHCEPPILGCTLSAEGDPTVAQEMQNCKVIEKTDETRRLTTR